MPEPVRSLAIESTVGLYKALKILFEETASNAVAASAMIQAVADELPSIGPRYEKYRVAMSETSPVARKAREAAAAIDQVIQKILTAEQSNSKLE